MHDTALVVVVHLVFLFMFAFYFVRVYTPVWAAPSDFAEIKVSKRMFVDHFPTRSCPAFKEALNRLKKEADDVVAQDSAATDKRTVTEPAPARVVGREGNAINASPADEIL